MILTYLCTYDDHLTQGSPSSAYISNLVMKEFDEEIGIWCDKYNISYTRYSDDMTFSGDFNPSELIIKVRKMIYKLGLELNTNKIHIINRSSSQSVTGIIVNKKTQVNTKYRNKIRQEIYYIKKIGDKFPERFMFQINENEYKNVFVVPTWDRNKMTRSLPYAFTEQGVAMLATILKTKKDIIIIDNYAGKELLDILKDINKNITIISKNITEELTIKYNKQYNNVLFIIIIIHSTIDLL